MNRYFINILADQREGGLKSYTLICKNKFLKRNCDFSLIICLTSKSITSKFKKKQFLFLKTFQYFLGI